MYLSEVEGDLATLLQSVKPLAAPRLSVLVWSRNGLVHGSKTDTLYLIRKAKLFVFDVAFVQARQAMSLTLPSRKAA